jgi:hypothetical protein
MGISGEYSPRRISASVGSLLSRNRGATDPGD